MTPLPRAAWHVITRIDPKGFPKPFGSVITSVNYPRFIPVSFSSLHTRFYHLANLLRDLL